MSTLRYEESIGAMRMYHGDNAGYWDRHDIFCVVTWLNPAVVMLSGYTARVPATRRTMRDMLDWLVSRKVEVVLAERAAAHMLPMAEDGPWGLKFIDVPKLAARLTRDKKAP